MRTPSGRTASANIDIPDSSRSGRTACNARGRTGGPRTRAAPHDHRARVALDALLRRRHQRRREEAALRGLTNGFWCKLMQPYVRSRVPERPVVSSAGAPSLLLRAGAHQ